MQPDPGAVAGVARVGVEVLEGQLHARPADVPQPCRPVQDHPHVHPPLSGTGSRGRLLRADEAEEEDGEKTKRGCRYGTRRASARYYQVTCSRSRFHHLKLKPILVLDWLTVAASSTKVTSSCPRWHGLSTCSNTPHLCRYQFPFLPSTRAYGRRRCASRQAANQGRGHRVGALAHCRKILHSHTALPPCRGLVGAEATEPRSALFA